MATQVETSTFFPTVRQPSKVHDSFQINSKLVWDCHQSLVKMAEHNRIQMV